jgi:hypothetical protein
LEHGHTGDQRLHGGDSLRYLRLENPEAIIFEGFPCFSSNYLRKSAHNSKGQNRNAAILILTLTKCNVAFEIEIGIEIRTERVAIWVISISIPMNFVQVRILAYRAKSELLIATGRKAVDEESSISFEIAKIPCYCLR